MFTLDFEPQSVWPEKRLPFCFFGGLTDYVLLTLRTEVTYVFSVHSLLYGFLSNFLGPATVRKGGFLGSHIGMRTALILLLIMAIIMTNIEHCVPSAQYVLDTVARTQQT